MQPERVNKDLVCHLTGRSREAASLFLVRPSLEYRRIKKGSEQTSPILFAWEMKTKCLNGLSAFKVTLEHIQSEMEMG